MVSWLAAGLVILGVLVIAVPLLWMGLNGLQRQSDEQDELLQGQWEKKH